jgi:Uma2 family endonuclease
MEAFLQSEPMEANREDFLGGRIYPQPDNTDRHNRITLNLAMALRPRARERDCEIFALKFAVHFRIAGQDALYYPDVLLACDPVDSHPYYRSAPCLLAEILSPQTERIDRAEKLFAYTTIPSLQEYLVVAQNEPRVEIHRREADGWVTSTVREQGSVDIRCLETTVDLETIYADLPPPRED